MVTDTPWLYSRTVLTTQVLASIGARLRGAGLTPRALEAWAGTARLSALPARLDAMRTKPATPAAAILGLLVGGFDVELGALRLAAGLIDDLIAGDLVERHGEQLRALVAILPLERAVLVCDRLDAPIERELVCWPDDSSHHLASAIPPGRRADWLDLGCGSAVAPLARPELATRIAGVDINPRAVRHATLGAALSGISHVAVALGSVGDPVEPAELVTCNAPIPGDKLLRSAVPEVWRRADPGFFEQLWPALRRAVRSHGTIVVHAAAEMILPALRDARGERVVVSYTPADLPGFAIAWWRPDAPDRLVVARRDLTPDRPHLDPRDRDDALAR